MSKRSGKSVLGSGSEFSWVANEASALQPVPAGETERQVATLTKPETSPRDVESRLAPPVEPTESPASTEEVARSGVDAPRATGPSNKRAGGNGQKLGIYLQSSTVRELKMQAIRENRSVSAIVQQLVTEYCSTQARLRG